MSLRFNLLIAQTVGMKNTPMASFYVRLAPPLQRNHLLTVIISTFLSRVETKILSMFLTLVQNKHIYFFFDLVQKPNLCLHFWALVKIKISVYHFEIRISEGYVYLSASRTNQTYIFVTRENQTCVNRFDLPANQAFFFSAFFFLYFRSCETCVYRQPTKSLNLAQTKQLY